jgi:hypothetical protein
MTSSTLNYTSFRPQIPDKLNKVVLSNQEGCDKYPREYMKMPSYLESRAAEYSRIEELKIDPRTARACTSGWDIDGYIMMPQQGVR